MVPHAGMNGELTSPGAAYASLHNMSPQMSAAAAAAAVVAYGRSPMVGHTLHAISVLWVVVHWEKLHAPFSTAEFPTHNSARGLTASLPASLRASLCCVAEETNLHLEKKESQCINVYFLFVLHLHRCFNWWINARKLFHAVNGKVALVDTQYFTVAVDICFFVAEPHLCFI